MSDKYIEPKENQAVVTSDGDNQSHTLTREETREILTPFAFEIDKTLYGSPLALPSKRGIAIAIDFTLIAALSGAPGELLAIVLAITLYKLGSNKRAEQMGKTKGRKRRKIMRFIAAFTLFIVLSSVLPPVFNWGEDVVNGTSSSPKENVVAMEGNNIGDTIKFTLAVTNAVAKLSSDECKDFSCWEKGLAPSVNILNEVDLPLEKKQQLIDELVSETKLNAEETALLKETFYQTLTANNEVPSKVSNSSLSNTQVDSRETSAAETAIPEKTEQSAPVYSLMELTKGIINDLGLGFGWAAFYFTVFTSVWNGQTPGKKLLGIQVVQLDGTPLSLWDSFGRYGGYGAGIATGLLGFIQIFWDANRQAIHDQISSTVVIDKK